MYSLALYRISIHALREEGDASQRAGGILLVISIHALREEGDWYQSAETSRWSISIHALREEGDAGVPKSAYSYWNFYPRPPRGGRPAGAGFLFGCP